MYVYIAITAIILAVMLWYMNNAAALKCNNYWLEFLLAGHLDKGSVHWRGVWYVNVQGNVHWECKFFKIINKIDHQKRPKVTSSICY